ncbi:disease resistance protein RGA2-like isoform X2 [Quercus lobata]|uniref:disease resistance protein RGA2-like isoform X2 n=1 Tax=Quercus lobata TaxID=97700 RepID=UPI001243A841|nr:disease resistance protein RGA2-like isoform X2 [Quercus lobata]
MAEIGYGIAVKVLELLRSVTFQEISSAWGVKSDLTKLERTVKAIKAVLLDAEEKQASDHRLGVWLGELKDVLKDAENVLDEFQYIVLQKEVMKRNGSTSKKERREMTHSFVRPRNVIGRDDAKKQILDLLMQQDADRNVNVISIVGIGGLGKTTLAKLVFDDKQVVSHFQLRMWVCVSDDFNVTRLTKEILKSAIFRIDENFLVDGLPNSLKELLKDKKILENLGVDELQCRLRELLKDKKFLLVLDDVWNDERKKWIELEDLILGGCNGSKILVTTRNSSVATIMDTTSTYNLKGLPEEDCVSLFVKLAFKVGQENQYPNLLNIGREIVKKCKGVPLAVSTLAGLLYSKVDEHEWKSIRDNEIWQIEQKEGDILPALKLSYNPLPFHLKQCFAYCSVYPKDFEFNNLQLIQFWLAHGILQSPANESQELEDVGDLYIKELLSRSFFQDFSDEELLFAYTFKMHDLVHDLALSIAQGECSVVTKKSILAAEVCHLSFSENGKEVTTQLEKLSKVQTIIFKTEQPASLLEACIARFKYLRVLCLDDSSFEVLPSSIGSLIHLRYLDLSNNCIIKQLPNSICKLHNLQTLLLGGCSNLERLPKDIRDIISLRHLYVTTKHTCLSEKAVGCLDSLRFLFIDECDNLKCLFEGTEGRLTNLRTLFVVECPSLTTLSLSIKYLTALEHLFIGHCKELSLTDKEENQDLKLSLRWLMIGKLPKLEVLPQWLQASANTLQHLEIEDCYNFTALPEWLPHLKSLQKLRIKDCPVFSSFPKGMQDLTALREIRIQNCEELILTNKEENQNIKSSLRLLKIENLPKLEVLPHWLKESANTLQHLEIEDCCNFTALPEWLPHLKSLHTLRIKDCPVFSSLPEGMQDLTALREFQIENCPKLSRKCREEVRHKIAHVPNIDFDEYFERERWRHQRIFRRRSF